MRDIGGKYLSDDVVEGVNSFLLEKGCLSPNITNIYLNYGFYKTEFTNIGKTDLGYFEIPEYWIKSYIRDKKINKIIK